MDEWFNDLVLDPDPGPDALRAFVDRTTEFLARILDDDRFRFLWDDDPSLRPEAIATFEQDVRKEAVYLGQTVATVSGPRLRSHGLLGRPLHFKLRVLDAIARSWTRVDDPHSARAWLTRVLAAIDVLLSSLIDAAGGAGGMMKEFQDSLSALATAG
jgi:hypothetical protein